MDHEFYGLAPINVFHGEMEEPYAYSHREDLKNRHMLVRRKFVISGILENAFIDITADDYYKLYINGKYVCQGPAPAYYFKYWYNRYDISDFLKIGENTIAVHVYYQGLVNRVWNSGDYRQGMIAEVFINDRLQLCTDSAWKYTICKAYKSGGIIGYDTQFLENIDMQLYEKGWKEEKFDDSKWENACENTMSDHKLFMQKTRMLDIYEVKPEMVTRIGEGIYLIDFGHEITGQFKMKAHGQKGQIIEIRCGEELDDNKRVRYEMRCNCNYREFWTLSGNGCDELEFYDYKAFRFAEVSGSDDIIDTSSFSAVVRHYPMDESLCQFQSSSKLLNKIWSICKNGVRYGTQEAYIDCPSREKGQYLGDITITAHSHIYLASDLKFFRKALEDFALSAFISPGLMAVAPGSHMQEIADYSLQWPMQLLLYYNHSGDVDFLKKMYPVIEKLEKYFKRYERYDGLLENVTDKWNMVDWPGNLRDNYDFDLKKPIGNGCHNVLNAFYYGMKKTINHIRDELHIGYRDETDGLRQAFINAFYNPETDLFADAEGSRHSALHSNVLPLLYGIAGGSTVKSIVSLIRKKRLNCGVYMSYFLLKALAAAEENDLLYELLTSSDEHSWGNMITEGATTCFEAWGKNQKWNTSLCHPWASAPIPVIIEDIIGLKPAAPGWREISFTPHISGSLDFIYLKLHTAAGSISVQYKNGCIDLELPEGISVAG